MWNMSSSAFISLVALLATFAGDSAQKSPLPVRFADPKVISYDHDGFIVNGKPVFIYSGSFHYFRCDPAEWRDRLEKIKAAGFNAIETYVPWNWHEQKDGRPDFAALDSFLTECQRLGFYVIIRPGPYICAEWDVGGYPEWLAGKGVGFRTASPADIRWAKYWYDEVLPVIRRHLITNGGSIILMQIENEYDYFSLPDSEKAVYLKSLYEDAMRNGINVPIITCWTRQVRDHSDSVFSQIMDACNFYPGWNITGTLPAIEEMKKQEPSSPPMITELQGGWFSSVGDDSVRYDRRYGPDQINALTKFVMAHGIKALNYYMLYGGTNFGYWGSRGKTTSYDYTAPISEPGGLWEKYRAVKLIGDFIRMAGPYLVRSHELKGGASSETKGVETILRTDGSVGLLYVWNTNAKAVDAQVTVNLPGQSPTNLSIPMKARDAYFLPVNFPLPGGETLHYVNIQVSSISEFNGRPLIVAYGNPGEDATIYAGQSLCTETIKNADQLFNWEGVYVLLTSRERAARSIMFNSPAGQVSLVSNSYLAVAGSATEGALTVRLQTQPGTNTFSLLATGHVASVRLDGKPVRTELTPRTNMLTFSMSTPQMRIPKIELTQIRAKPETEAPLPSEAPEARMTGDSLDPLGSQGDYENGYTDYAGEFTMPVNGRIKCDYYDNDWHTVLIDGKTVPGLTGSDEEEISSTDFAAGNHKITVLYEDEGRPNGDFMEQEKGLKSISGTTFGSIIPLVNWKCAPTASPYPGVRPEQASPAFDDSRWNEVAVGDQPQEFIRPSEGWWFRTTINLDGKALEQNPEIIFRGVDDNALVYVNGRLAMKHQGWDSPFSVYLDTLARTGANIVAVYVQNEESYGGIYRPVILKLGKPIPAKASLRFHHSLDGELAGWELEPFDDSGWKSAIRFMAVPSADGVTWYRGRFTLPSNRGWVIPWRLHIESTGNMQIWINGKLLGRFYAEGPQSDFYLPDGWLNKNGSNSVTSVLRPTGNGEKAPAIRSAYVAPYYEYMVQRHQLEIKLK